MPHVTRKMNKNAPHEARRNGKTAEDCSKPKTETPKRILTSEIQKKKKKLSISPEAAMVPKLRASINSKVITAAKSTETTTGKSPKQPKTSIHEKEASHCKSSVVGKQTECHISEATGNKIVGSSVSSGPAKTIFNHGPAISLAEFVLLGKFVAASQSFDELEERVSKEYTFKKEDGTSVDKAIIDITPITKSNEKGGDQHSFRIHHSLHRLLSVIRAGTLEQQEAAYKVCVMQWVLLAREPGFPIEDEEAAYNKLDELITNTNVAPHTAKTRINALILFLEGTKLDAVTTKAPLPYPVAPQPTKSSCLRRSLVPPTEKTPQHPEMASGNYARLAMDKEGKPRFVCIVNGCQRSYASANCLARHQVQHFELYACPACPQTLYSRTDHIQKHWENCHPNRPRRDLEKTLELMYRNGGAPPALKMWVNGVIWTRKADGKPRRRNMKRKHLDALRDTERAGYVAQKMNWAKLKGLKDDEMGIMVRSEIGKEAKVTNKQQSDEEDGNYEYKETGSCFEATEIETRSMSEKLETKEKKGDKETDNV